MSLVAATVELDGSISGEDATNEPSVMLGCELQLSNSFKLITEN